VKIHKTRDFSFFSKLGHLFSSGALVQYLHSTTDTLKLQPLQPLYNLQYLVIYFSQYCMVCQCSFLLCRYIILNLKVAESKNTVLVYVLAVHVTKIVQFCL